MVVAFTTVKLVDVVAPNLTVDASRRFAPVIVTVVPPRVVPYVGVKALIVGAGWNRYSLEDIAVPPGVVTEIVTVPVAWALVTALIVVALVTL
jgi:hypothetical protein